jgi:hypothetical protein
MGDDNDEAARAAERDRLAANLATETGITEAQARELIRLLGTERNSLLREARIISRKQPR